MTSTTYPAAITQDNASPTMSKRYVHVNTMEVIKIMEEQGFAVETAKVDKVRKSNPDFARHLVVFRSPYIHTPDGSYTPQLLWTNSHNGKSPAEFRLGMYRFVCENGLVIGSDLASHRIKHIGDLAKQVVEKVREMSSHSIKVFDQIEKWSKVDLTIAQRIDFAKSAMELRFGDTAEQFKEVDALTIHRAEDDKGDLWSTFNIVQENTVKGGLVGHNANNRQVSSKKLDAIGLNLDYNQKLWNLAASYAA